MKIVFSAVCAIAMLFLVVGNGYSDDKGNNKDHKFSTELSGFNEVHFCRWEHDGDANCAAGASRCDFN